MKNKISFGDTLTEESFHLLTKREPNEYYTRVDRYTIRRYYMNEENIKQSEFLFYPSIYGTEDIKIGIEQNTISPIIKYHYEKLLKRGDGVLVYGEKTNNKKPKRFNLKEKNNGKKIFIKYKLQVKN